MNLVKFKKDKDLLNFEDAVNSIFSDWSGINKNFKVTPRAEITEDEDNFYLNLEMPGVKKEDVKINIEDNVLSIKGTKKQEYKKEEKNVITNERYYGEFSRSFNLTNEINHEGIDAEFKDGVLNIVLPKVEEAKPQIKEVNIK